MDTWPLPRFLVPAMSKLSLFLHSAVVDTQQYHDVLTWKTRHYSSNYLSFTGYNYNVSQIPSCAHAPLVLLTLLVVNNPFCDPLFTAPCVLEDTTVKMDQTSSSRQPGKQYKYRSLTLCHTIKDVLWWDLTLHRGTHHGTKQSALSLLPLCKITNYHFNVWVGETLQSVRTAALVVFTYS